MNKDFVHLHVHSNFSVQDGLCPPEKIVRAAYNAGFRAIALTDHGNMGGHHQFVKACYEFGIKPILGIEGYLCKDAYDQNPVVVEEGGHAKRRRPKYNHIVLLAKDDEGYNNLLNLMKISCQENIFYYEPRFDWNILSQHSRGLICLSSCLAGELAKTALEDEQKTKEIIYRYKELFRDDFYIELQDHSIPEEKEIYNVLYRLAKETNTPVVVTNDVHYVEKSDAAGHSIVVFMRYKREEELFNDEELKGLQTAYKTPEFYLKSPEEMASVFSHIPEAIHNTMEICEKCSFQYVANRPIVWPEFKIDNIETIESWRKKKCPELNIKQAFLVRESFLGLKRLGLMDNNVYVDRLKHELNSIFDLGYEDYFLVQWKIAQFARERAILTGAGRGSGSGSLVLYCLGVTKIDPVKYGLIFERFLNPGRGPLYDHNLDGLGNVSLIETEENLRDLVFSILKSSDRLDLWPRCRNELLSIENQGLEKLFVSAYRQKFYSETNNSNSMVAYVLGLCPEPKGEMRLIRSPELADIDCDFDGERREEVIQYIKDEFGEDNVVSVGAYQTYKIKSAIRVVLKYKGLSEEEVRKYTQDIPFNCESLDEAMEVNNLLRGRLLNNADERKLIESVIGAYSAITQHAAGVIISSNPVHTISPLIRCNKGIITAMSMEDVAEVGLVKFDILGLSNLSIVSRCIDMIEKYTGKKIDLASIPLDDKKCIESFNRGDTDTIFQFETDSFRDILPGNISSFNDLIDMVAINRPGSIKFVSPKYYRKYRRTEPDEDGYIEPPDSPIGTYQENKKNPARILKIHPIVDEILKETYGIPIYQEQFMKIAQQMAGWNLIESDKLRKAIGKKKDKLFEECRVKFIKGAKENHIPPDVIEKVWNMFSHFGGYAFNKAHAAAYALLGYWNMFLREYYPVFWYAAVFDVEFSTSAGKKKMREEQKNYMITSWDGYSFRTKLEWLTYSAKRRQVIVRHPDINISDDVHCVIIKNNIFLPFCSILNVGGGFNIAKTREEIGGQFSSLEQFVEVVNIPRSTIEHLIMNDAFSCLKESPGYLLKVLPELIEKRNKNKKKKVAPQPDEQFSMDFFS